MVAFLPLGDAELASRDTIVFHSDSAIAIADKKEADAAAEKAAAETPVATGGTAAGGVPPPVSHREVQLELKAPSGTPPESSDAARQKMMKASKEQRRRSVNISYGGADLTKLRQNMQ